MSKQPTYLTTFKLKNGSEVQESLVVVVMLTLMSLQLDILTLHELFKKSHDPLHTMYGNTANIAEEMQLTKDGVMCDAIRNIIQSAIVYKGGLNFSINSPTINGIDDSRVLH